ncbi:hypothetical protein [Clostridium sp. MD294]|uniref:hypothetical protein n=1 Tax=Clostridium sp. MD294 TaxID=97138 RepID=UPI0002C8C1FD|nr:hypothetical protein [Clostridium sp. MD294]NDO47029.1 hypothetical protein [Clostridium sp. MD294]USF31210.1 hypothetical protein C820_002656 [Clostridium sp. MD294]
MRKRVNCNENCFECIYDDCIMDILPSEREKQRERQKLYYQRHREEKKLIIEHIIKNKKE